MLHSPDITTECIYAWCGKLKIAMGFANEADLRLGE